MTPRRLARSVTGWLVLQAPWAMTPSLVRAELEHLHLQDNAGMNLMMVRLREMAGRIELPVEVSSHSAGT
jgi:hypothetical protein